MLSGEKHTKLAQKLGQLQPFIAVFLWPTCTFSANLTTFLLQEWATLPGVREALAAAGALPVGGGQPVGLPRQVSPGR